MSSVSRRFRFLLPLFLALTAVGAVFPASAPSAAQPAEVEIWLVEDDVAAAPDRPADLVLDATIDARGGQLHVALDPDDAAALRLRTADHVGGYLAIALDGAYVGAPVLREPFEATGFVIDRGR